MLNEPEDIELVSIKIGKATYDAIYSELKRNQDEHAS